MLQIVLGQDQPVPQNRIRHLIPSVYCAVNHDGKGKQQQQQDQNDGTSSMNNNSKGVSVEYRARLTLPKTQSDIFLFSNESSHQPSITKNSSSSTSLKNSVIDSSKTEFFLQWNLTRCLPFLRRPVTVIAEMYEVYEHDDFKMPAEVKKQERTNSKTIKTKNDNNDNDENDEENDEDDEEEKQQENDNDTKQNSLSCSATKMTIVVPGMVTNTNTKDTIWIGKFDVKERVVPSKKPANTNTTASAASTTLSTTAARRFFRLSLVRMIVGSHMLMSPDRQVFTVVVPLPDVFSTAPHVDDEDALEITAVETVSLLTASTISAQQLTAAQRKLLLLSNNEMELKLKNALLIRSATNKNAAANTPPSPTTTTTDASSSDNTKKKQPQQVEVVGVLDIRKLTEEDRRNRAGKTNHSQMQEERRKGSKLSVYGTYLCILKTNIKSSAVTDEKIKATPNGIDLVLEMSLVKKGALASSTGALAGGDSPLPQVLSNGTFAWTIFLALLVGLVLVIWSPIEPSSGEDVASSFVSGADSSNNQKKNDGERRKTSSSRTTQKDKLRKVVDNEEDDEVSATDL